MIIRAVKNFDRFQLKLYLYNIPNPILGRSISFFRTPRRGASISDDFIPGIQDPFIPGIRGLTQDSYNSNVKVIDILDMREYILAIIDS